MNLNLTSQRKLCVFNDSQDESQQQSVKKQLNQKPQIVKYQKIYAFQPTKDKERKHRDKFTINQVQKGLFTNQNQSVQYDHFWVKQKKPIHIKQTSHIKDHTQQRLENKAGELKKQHGQRSQSIQKKFPHSQQPKKKFDIKQQSSQGQENGEKTFKKIDQAQQINKNKQFKNRNKLPTQKFIPRSDKIFRLNLSDSSMSSSEQNSENNKLNNRNRQKQHNNYQKQTEQQQNQEQPQEEEEFQSQEQSDIVYNDFALKLQPQFVVLDQIGPQQRLRAIIKRQSSGLNNLWPQYTVHLQSNDTQIMYIKKISFFSFNNGYTFHVRTKQGKQRYFGKIQCFLGGSEYKLFVSEDGVTQKLKAEIIVPSQFNSKSPRYFVCFYLMNGYQMKDLVLPHDMQKTTKRTLQGYHRYQKNRDKIEIYHTRKAIYSQNLKGFVLNFNGRIQLPSIKNFIMQQVQTKKQKLMFGKLAKDIFKMHISHPLSIFVGSAISLLQFQVKLVQ